MQLMVCTEKGDWNVQLKEVEAANWCAVPIYL